MKKSEFLELIIKAAKMSHEPAVMVAADFTAEIVETKSRKEALKALKKHSDLADQLARESWYEDNNDELNWHSCQLYAYNGYRRKIKEDVYW